ncbi:MAG: hypothetical protein ABW061_07205 [Polyangiaceae bacterium]
MIRAKTLRTVFGAGLVGLLAFIPGAQANTNTHASAFQSDDGLSDGCFFRGDTGTYRTSTTGVCAGNLYEVASVTRTPPSTTSALTVYVDGTCSPQGISCQIRSFDYNGTLLGAHSATVTGAPFDTPFSFTSSETSFWGYMQISCQFGTAVTGSSCRLFGFDVTP